MSGSYLLDTDVAIWLDKDVGRVPPPVLEILNNPAAELWVSSVSFWELSIKQCVGKIDPLLRLEPTMKMYAMRELSVTSKYADAVRSLPLLHGDPFDRMLVAQAMVEGMTLVTGGSETGGVCGGVLQV